MKIGIDVTPLSDKQHAVRGSGFYIQYLKESLQKYDHENQYIFYTRKDGIPKNVDIVHIPYFEPFFLTLSIHHSKKTVVTAHDLIPMVFPEHFPVGIKGKLKWEIQKKNLQRADAIITDSQSSNNDIIRLTGISHSKIHIVPLAAGEKFRKLDLLEINMKRRIVDLNKKYHLPENFALYVGDVTWNKNVPRIVQACQQAKVQLVMVGKALAEVVFDRDNTWNKERVRVEELAKNDKHIFRLGFVPTEDLVLIYNIAKVFVMPSLYEGFGLPILEAMQCGCPVITSKEGSLPDVAGDAAYYADAYNVESIAKAITKIFSDEVLRKEFSHKGLLHAKEFNWRETTKQTVAVYEKIHTDS